MIARFHLPGLFEFYDFYKEFLKVYRENRDFFYEWADIGSIYGAPDDCIWGGGRMGAGKSNTLEVLKLLSEYNISGRLTFSNSLLTMEHLEDKKCNKLCQLFEDNNSVPNGVIVYSDILVDYLRKHYPGLYLVSSTTKVITDFKGLEAELSRDDFSYVVPDFRLNKSIELLSQLSRKDKVEFLCNECCYIGCLDRKRCYENVSRTILDENYPDFKCTAPNANEGYLFSKAMKNPAFISAEDIINTYLPLGFTNFKIEGRELGSAVVLEMLLYYMVKPEHHIRVRELIYLDSMLNLF